MGPNDVEIVRVYGRAVSGPITEDAFPSNADFEIVVEVEAGSAIFATGAQYVVGLVVVDYNAFNLFPTPTANPGTPAINVPDHLESGLWTGPSQQFVYTVTKNGPPALNKREGDFCEALASLSVGVSIPDMSFARSGLFIINHP